MTPAYLEALSGPEYITILGIDPGSTTMGVAALHVNVRTLAVEGAEITTLNANKPSGGRSTNGWMLETHSERAMRIRELAWMLGAQLEYFRPVAIACEAPFFNPGRPNAYQVLVEVFKTVENTAYYWCPTRPLYRIETSVAKAAVAVPAALKLELKAIKDSKQKVEFCVRHHPEMSKFIDFSIHDEHGADAAIVAYAQLLRFRAGDYSISF